MQTGMSLPHNWDARRSTRQTDLGASRRTGHESGHRAALCEALEPRVLLSALVQNGPLAPEADGFGVSAVQAPAAPFIAAAVTSLSATPIDEGATTALTGTIDDPGAQGPFTVTVNWNNGVQTFTSVPAGPFTFARRYVDDNPTGTPVDQIPITVNITDRSGNSAVAGTSVQVTNVSPSISGLVASPINENDMTTLTGTINDPGALDRFTVAIDWGNGTLTFNNVARGPFSFTRQYLDDDPTGTPVDHVPISLAITDDDTGLVTAGTSVRVSNVAPTVVNLSATAINEGGTTTLTGTISDPGGLDTFALTVDWGNGTQSFNNVPAGSFSFTRQYRDDAPSGSANDRMPISVTAVDDDGGVSTSNTTVLVRNIAPAISSISSSAAAISAASGEPVTILGSFTDPGSLDSHTVQVDWGDGSVSNGAVTGNSGAGTFRATHTYAAGGVFTATLTLRDDDTGAASRSSTALVTGIAINKRVLQIVATTGNDQVKVKRREDIVHVKTRFAPPAMFNYADFARIEVFLLEGDDKARIDNSIDKRVKLEGGSGHDKLKGGSGDDTLRGGPGNDQLNGKAGNDLIEGGAGADKLTGQRGSDVLLGGAGDDRLRGRHGADLMAGDAGADRLKGGREGDILIGGSANLNSNALRTILDEWRSTKDLTVRVTNIRNSGGLNGTAVLASDKLGRDGEPDLLKGSGSIDWLFADTDILRGRAFTGDPAEAKTRMVDLLTSVG